MTKVKKSKKLFKSILTDEQYKDLIEAKKKLKEIKKILEDAKKKVDELKEAEDNKPIIFK